MKQNLRALFAATLLPLVLSGCLVAPVIPPTGFLFTSIEAPLDYDSNATLMGPKSGDSTAINILGLIAVGNASLREAADDGGIRVVHSADYKYLNVLYIFQSYTTVAYGE